MIAGSIEVEVCGGCRMPRKTSNAFHPSLSDGKSIVFNWQKVFRVRDSSTIVGK